MKIPFFVRLVFNRYFFQKLFAIVLLLFVVYLLKSFLAIFLVTFLFSFLFLDLAKNIYARLWIVWSKIRNIAFRSFCERFFTETVVVTIVYVVFIAIIAFLISNLIPRLVDEWTKIAKQRQVYVNQINQLVIGIEGFLSTNIGINATDNQLTSDWLKIDAQTAPISSPVSLSGEPVIAQSLLESNSSDVKSTIISGAHSPAKSSSFLLEYINKINTGELINKVFQNIKELSIILFNLILALLLSYIFIVDRKKISAYLQEIKNGNFSFLYHEYSIIFTKITKWFGLIFKAQAIIAFANSILTVCWLLLISFIHQGSSFPFIFTLGLLVFIFWFIPVFGTFLSSLPIILIGYNYGGWTVVFEIVIMVAIVHAVEAYYLNPKIVSSYTDFPVFVTFIILIVAEHFFWFVWLLIGVPLFYILLDILHDLDFYITKVRAASNILNGTHEITKDSIDNSIRLSRSGKKNIKE